MKKRKKMENEEMQVASVTECTGLIPALPQDESEDENSAELYAIHKAMQTKQP